MAKKGPYRVYVTYLPDGRYYVGYSGRKGKAWEKYFGSSRIIKEHIEAGGKVIKFVLFETEKKSHALFQELLLQIQVREDPRHVGEMMNIRLNKKHLAGFTPVEWKPLSKTTIRRKINARKR